MGLFLSCYKGNVKPSYKDEKERRRNTIRVCDVVHTRTNKNWFKQEQNSQYITKDNGDILRLTK